MPGPPPAADEPRERTSVAAATAGIDLHATLLLSGAAIMAVELLGARVMGPHFGVSLYAWTALITVVLIALAVGYWVGGVIADRWPTRAGLYRLLGIAAFAVAAIPFEREPVISACLSLGMRAGALVAALSLFFPSLFALACVTPYALRLGTGELAAVGRSAGRLYAVSTVGSCAGTLLTGFYLIPTFSLSTGFYLTGGLLLAAALAFGLRSVTRLESAAAAALALLVALAASVRSMPAEVGFQTVFHRVNAYGDVRVVDYGDNRFMLLDGIPQSAIERETGNSIMTYSYVVLSRLRMCRPDARRALVVGLGGGYLAMQLARWGIVTEAVEINPAIIDAATTRFGFDPDVVKVYVEDARTLLASARSRYDLVIMDAYASESVPYHLITREVFELVRERVLTPSGVVALNIVGGEDDHLSSGAQAVIATLRSVFPHVVSFSARIGPSRQAETWNLEVLASSASLGPAKEMQTLTLATFPRGTERRFSWDGVIAETETAMPLLDDDFNPFDTLNATTAIRVRESAVSRMPASVRASLHRD
jgi:spermidine synthase